ncbi:unnamed protein product [Schistosoma haematobium]|nr:unnamed protein product [Schistosoma haematobium]
MQLVQKTGYFLSSPLTIVESVAVVESCRILMTFQEAGIVVSLVVTNELVEYRSDHHLAKQFQTLNFA